MREWRLSRAVGALLFKNGELVGECQDSVESYANRMSTGDTAALNDTIMKFATSAKAYLLK